MASPALAGIHELAHRLGVDVSTLDESRAQGNLSDASTLVRQVTKLTYLDDAGDLDVAAVTDVVEMVVLAAAKRAYENPTGVTQKSTGDVSLSYAARSPSSVYLTADEIRMLRNEAGISQLYTQRTTRGDDQLATVYVPVVGTTNEFPWYASDDPTAFPT